MPYFGTLVNRIRGKSRPVEKWYDMGDVNLAKTFKKPCLKDIKTAGENVKTVAKNDEKDEHQTNLRFQRVHVSSSDSEKNHQTQKKKKLEKWEQQNRPKKPLSAVDLYHLLTSTLKKPTKRTTTTTTSRPEVISTTTTTSSFVRIFSTSSPYHHRPTEIITSSTQAPTLASQNPTDFFIRIFSTPSTIYFGETPTTTTTTTTKPPFVAQTQRKHFHIVDSHVNTIEIVDIDSPKVDRSQPKPGDIEIVGDSESDGEEGGVYVYVNTYSCAPTHCQRKVPYKQFNNRVLQHRNIYP